MENDNLTQRLTELLSAIEMFDGEIAALREARKDAEQEVRAIFEQLSQQTGAQQFTTGTYRVRYATEVVVLKPDELHQLYPDLVEVVVSTNYKPDKPRLRALLESAAAQQLEDIARLDRQVVVEKETRKSAKVVAK